VPRVKRPRLKREGPIRSWPAAMGADAEDPAGAESPRQQRPAGNGQDPLHRGVVLGGQVVDEWIRQAQQTARMLGTPAAGAGWPDAGGRMFRAASDFMAAWMTAVSAPMQAGAAPWNGAGTQPRAHDNGAAAPPSNGSQPSAGGATAPPEVRTTAAAMGPRVTVDVSSPRPVEISIVLNARSGAPLRVLDLRTDDGKAPRIRAPHLEPADGDGLSLRITVPADQPAGTYRATIIDEATDSGVGLLTVKVRE
jgi:hypothetical protein